MPPAVRVSFLVDGFNLYHSIKSAERQLGGAPLRWLDLDALCRTLVSSVFGHAARLESVHYFSALARHLEVRRADVVRRHRTLIAALESTGVQVSLATFKRREHYHRLSEFRIRVPGIRRWWRVPADSLRLWHRSHEEKETDVAIACKLLELLARGACDAAVIVSGDTDLAPAFRTARMLYPGAAIIVAFPFDRHNHDLERVATRSVRISAKLYRNHQLPAVIVGRDGRMIAKPATW